MTGPLSWIANPIKRKASARPALASDASSAVGRPAWTTAGRVAAATCGTRSIRVDCAPRASTSGLQPSASRAVDESMVAAFRVVCELTKVESLVSSTERVNALVKIDHSSRPATGIM